MKRLYVAGFCVVLMAMPGVVLGQAGADPSEDCTAPVVQISPLPYQWQSSVENVNDVDLSDLSPCAAGAGGMSTTGGDWVYELVIYSGHDVTCSLTSSADTMAVALTTNCAAPLTAGACVWGEVAPAQETPVSFNTATLALPPGTYYLFGDRALPHDWWTMSCSGSLPVELTHFDIE